MNLQKQEGRLAAALKKTNNYNRKSRRSHRHVNLKNHPGNGISHISEILTSDFFGKFIGPIERPVRVWKPTHRPEKKEVVAI